MRNALFAITLPAAMLAGGATLHADTPLDAESFERYTSGYTLTFTFEGAPYGMEQYLPGRRVIWAFWGAECEEGIWYPRDDMICFSYEAMPEEQCWHFHSTERGLRAIFQGPNGPSTELYEAERSTAPLLCEGPDVGV